MTKAECNPGYVDNFCTDQFLESIMSKVMYSNSVVFCLLGYLSFASLVYSASFIHFQLCCDLRSSIIPEINVNQCPNFVYDAQKSSTFVNLSLLNNFEILLL